MLFFKYSGQGPKFYSTIEVFDFKDYKIVREKFLFLNIINYLIIILYN